MKFFQIICEAIATGATASSRSADYFYARCRVAKRNSLSTLCIANTIRASLLTTSSSKTMPENSVDHLADLRLPGDQSG
jgi:hypothetical protein